MTSNLLGQSYKHTPNQDGGNSPTGSSIDFWRISNITVNRGNDQELHHGSTSMIPSPSLGSVRTVNRAANIFGGVPSSSQVQARPPTASVQLHRLISTGNTASNSKVIHSMVGVEGAANRGAAAGGANTSSSGGGQGNSRGPAGGGSIGVAVNALNAGGAAGLLNQEDLDSSNVLYDDDFEIEEESKQNNDF